MTTADIQDIVKNSLTVPTSEQLAPIRHSGTWMNQLKALVNLIPFAGGLVAQEIQNVMDYRESEFFRKYVTYVLELSDISSKDRTKFAEEVESKAQDYAGNVLAGMVDRLDNINKQKVFANLTKARINGDISIEDFFRLAAVLERIPYVDLAQLHLYQKPYYDESGDTHLLYSTGVLRPVMLHQDGDTYILSPLGQNLMRWGLKIQVSVEDVKGTSTGIGWEEVDELPDLTAN